MHIKNTYYPVSALFLFSLSLVLGACQPATNTSQATTTALTPSLEPSPVFSTDLSESSSLEELWTFQTGGSIWGAATLADGVVYFGSDDACLYAVDARTGEMIWKYTTGGIIRSQPAIGDGLVYIASDDGFLYAIKQQTGELFWRTNIGNFVERHEREDLFLSSYPTYFDYFQSSPVIWNDQVFVGSWVGNVYSLNARSGKVTWSFITGDKVRAAPMVVDGTVYIGSWDKYFYALDATNGKLRWKTKVNGQVQSAALVSGSLVVSASRKASVFALDALTGEQIWDYDYGSNSWVESSPVLSNGSLFIGSSANYQVVELHPQTGKAVSTFVSKSFFWSTPAIGNNTAYIGGVTFRHNSDGGLFAIKMVDGKLSIDPQDVRIIPVIESKEYTKNWSGVAASPVIVDGIIYFGGLDGTMYAVQD